MLTRPYLVDRLSRRFRKRWRQFYSRFEEPYRELKRLGITAYFDGYPRRAIRPEWDDLYSIYTLVLGRKPRVILELGGGYSTFVLAHVARRLSTAGHEVTLWSVDESEYWQEVVRSRMPAALLPYVRFFHSAPVMTEIAGEKVAKFSELPVEVCDFVYVDGGLPAGHTRDAGADALLLAATAPPDYAILVDGRVATCEFLRRRLPGGFASTTNVAGQTLFVRTGLA